jgi:hypothetical protein
VATEERGDFVAIAANGHGTPAAAMGARVVIEEEAASRIGATAHRRVGAFDEEFGCGTRNGSEEPFEAAFAGDELQTPAFGVGNEFVMAFREAQQVVDGLNPDFREGLLLDERSEDGAERLAEAQDLEENRIDSLRLGGKQGMKARGALGGNDTDVDKERDKLGPGEVVRRGRGIGEVESEASSDEVRCVAEE